MPHELERQTEPTETFELRNSPYTLEGELEGWRRFGRGTGSAHGRRRLMALLMAAIILIPLIVNGVVWLADLSR